MGLYLSHGLSLAYFSLLYTGNEATIRQLRQNIKAATVVKIIPGTAWEPTALQPWPPIEKVLAAKFWHDDEFVDARKLLLRPVANPELSLSVSQTYWTIKQGPKGKNDAQSTSQTGELQGTAGSSSGNLIVVDMHEGATLPSAVSCLPFVFVFIEIPGGFFAGLHTIILTLVQRDIPLVIVGEIALLKPIMNMFREFDGGTMNVFEMHLFHSEKNGHFIHSDLGLFCVSKTPPKWPLPKYTTTFNSTGLESLLPVECAGALMSYYGVNLEVTPTPWVLVLTDHENLPCQLATRLGQDVNVCVGTVGESVPTSFPAAVTAGLKEADRLSYVFWAHVMTAINCGHPVDLSGESYVQKDAEEVAEADAAKQAAAAKAAEAVAAKPAAKPKPKRSPRASKKRQVDAAEADTPTQDSQSSSASATPPPKKAAKIAAAGLEAADPPENPPDTPTALSAFTSMMGGVMGGRGRPGLRPGGGLSKVGKK